MREPCRCSPEVDFARTHTNSYGIPTHTDHQYQNMTTQRCKGCTFPGNSFKASSRCRSRFVSKHVGKRLERQGVIGLGSVSSGWGVACSSANSIRSARILMRGARSLQALAQGVLSGTPHQYTRPATNGISTSSNQRGRSLTTVDEAASSST